MVQDLLSCLFIFSTMKDNKKFTNVFTGNISKFGALKLVMSCKRNLPNIAADTVALTETANKLGLSLKGLIY